MGQLRNLRIIIKKRGKNKKRKKKKKTTPSSPATPPPTPKKINNWKAEMLALMNEERSKEGANALCLNSKLTNAAEKHNQDMVENKIWSHTGSDGSSIEDRITRENYKWGTTGQNILRGEGSVALAMEKFMS